jgi:hypothetical protein
MDLVLYSTAGCHLCEEAEALLRAERAARPALLWEVVDIASDDRLFAAYGWHIPVLRDGAGRELRWPFDPASLRRYLDAPSVS